MDDVWERSIPFYTIGIQEAIDICKEYDKSLTIVDLQPLYSGCRNSNYKVHTNKGPFLLRICPLHTANSQKEKTVSEIFSSYIRVPRLLSVSEHNLTERTYLLYEYIDGISMQEIINRTGKLEDRLLIQVAESAAYIHSADVINNGEFETLADYPPFFGWYTLFLENKAASERLGSTVKERVERLIAAKASMLQIIDQFTSFIHSDFRPANMLVDQHNAVWVIDWELAEFGHSLADIGQFFRYTRQFTASQMNTFAAVYNSIAHRNLPDNWYALSKLRELVNPLQMIGAEGDRPAKYADLKKLIIESLAFFWY
jgi:Predicted aminoglycoside phosphotransferase